MVLKERCRGITYDNLCFHKRKNDQMMEKALPITKI
jgi:hypothetical protein